MEALASGFRAADEGASNGNEGQAPRYSYDFLRHQVILLTQLSMMNITHLI